MFDPSKPFTTRGGKTVTDFRRLTDPTTDGSIYVGVVNGDVETWNIQGEFHPSQGKTNFDLVNRPARQFVATADYLISLLTPFALAYRKASDPGTSDLYDEQPFHITVTLGDLRKASAVVPWPKP